MTETHSDTLVVFAIVPSDESNGLDLLGPAVAQVTEELIRQTARATVGGQTVTVESPLGQVDRHRHLADDEDGQPLYFDTLRFRVDFHSKPTTR